MEGRPLVSVVIPAKGQSYFLAEAVRSVHEQRRSDVEIIVAAGDDESAHVAAHLPDVYVLAVPDHGAACAKNTGVDAAAGKYIVTLDSDDVLGPYYLTKTLAAVDETKHNIVSTHMQTFGNGKEVWETWYDPDRLLEENGFHCASLFSKTLWRAVGGFNDGLPAYEDWEFWIRCSRLEPHVRIVEERLFNWRRHGSNSTNLIGGFFTHEELKHAMVAVNPAIYGDEAAAWSRRWLEERATSAFRDQARLRYVWFPWNASARILKHAVDRSDDADQLRGGVHRVAHEHPAR